MSASVAIRPARPADAPACAAILNDWIDETPWMPRIHPRKDVERHYREFVFQKRKVIIAGGEAPIGYLAVDAEEGFITSFFVKSAERSKGAGGWLLQQAKAQSGGELQLWTFEKNKGAQRFYEREGFSAVERSDGDNEEGLPDVLYRWIG